MSAVVMVVLAAWVVCGLIATQMAREHYRFEVGSRGPWPWHLCALLVVGGPMSIGGAGILLVADIICWWLDKDARCSRRG